MPSTRVPMAWQRLRNFPSCLESPRENKRTLKFCFLLSVRCGTILMPWLSGKNIEDLAGVHWIFMLHRYFGSQTLVNLAVQFLKSNDPTVLNYEQVLKRIKWACLSVRLISILSLGTVPLILKLVLIGSKA